MNRAFYIKRNGLFVPDRCGINPAFLGSWQKPVSGGGGGGGFTYTKINNATASATVLNPATTAAKDCTTANLIILSVTWAGGAMSVSDSKGNSYTPLTVRTNATNGVVTQMFYCLSPTVDSAMTFTAQATSGVGYPAVHMIAAKKSSGAPVFDAESGAVLTGSSTTWTVPSITPAVDNEFGVTVVGVGNPYTSTPSGITASYSILNAVTAGADAYVIQTTATASSPVWTLPSANDGAAVAQAFFK